MNEPKKAEKGRCAVCGKFAVIENGVCSLPVCQRRREEGRVEELNEITDNKILSEVLRVISKKTLETGKDIGIVQYLEGKALIEAADRIDELAEIERDSMSKWKAAETAPKDGNQFIANVGLPWATLAAWNEAEQKYVYATMSACVLKNGVDVWFENEQAAESELIAWKPLPEIEVEK